MEIKKGAYVTRNSYQNDTIFKVVNIKGNVCYLKGVDVRLYADSVMDDLVLTVLPKEEDEISEESLLDDESLMRGDFFSLPGKVLHIDGDSEYLERCLKFYRKNKVFAVGKKISETDIASKIHMMLLEYQPDIVIITGHDSFKKNGDIHDLRNYKNTENFIKAVKEARKFEKSHEKLVIIAGACQSNYEELIKAGANFASSPKRVNIHALDPAIIASVLATSERDKQIDLVELLDKTKYGKDGMGGLRCHGLMYVGYPR